MADMHAETRETRQREAEQRVKRAGYRAGGRVSSDVKEDAKMVAAGVHQHEAHDHKGEAKTKLRLRRGGEVKGDAAPKRLDRRARGGGIPGKKGHKGGVTLIVHNTPMHPAEKQQAVQQGAMQGMRIGAALGARKAAQGMMGRPGGGMPAGGMPPGAGLPITPPGAGMGAAPPPGALPTVPPRQPIARGGKVKVRAHERRKAGGAV